MKIGQVGTFEGLEQYLQEFTNFSGDPAPYDFNGAFHLYLALLSNLARHHLDADFESHEEFRAWFTEEAGCRFFERLQIIGTHA